MARSVSAAFLGWVTTGEKQVRDAFVDREFEHLGVHHGELDLGGLRIVQDRQDDGVDGNALARAGCAGHEQVRHLVDAADHRRAEDVLADGDLELRLVRLVLRGLQDLAEVDRLARVVRHLDADRGLAGKRRHDAHAAGPHGERQIVGQVHDLAHLHAGRGLELEHGDHRAGVDLRHAALDVEVLELVLQKLGLGEHVLFRDLLRYGRNRVEQIKGRELVGALLPSAFSPMNSKVACTGFGCFSGFTISAEEAACGSGPRSSAAPWAAQAAVWLPGLFPAAVDGA